MNAKSWEIEFKEDFHSFKCPICDNVQKIISYLPIKVSLLECSNCNYQNRNDNRNI